MYKIIPEQERRYYSIDEIRKNFDGKWLFLVNSQFRDINQLVGAKIAVVADHRYEGFETSVYTDLDHETNEIICEYDLLDDGGWDDLEIATVDDGLVCGEILD